MVYWNQSFKLGFSEKQVCALSDALAVYKFEAVDFHFYKKLSRLKNTGRASDDIFNMALKDARIFWDERGRANYTAENDYLHPHRKHNAQPKVSPSVVVGKAIRRKPSSASLAKDWLVTFEFVEADDYQDLVETLCPSATTEKEAIEIAQRWVGTRVPLTTKARLR